MSKLKLTAEDKCNIIKLLNDGATQRDVALQYGVSESHVGTVLYESMNPNLRKLSELTVDDWDEIARLFRSGVTVKDIAFKFNVHKKILRTELNNRGINISKLKESKEVSDRPDEVSTLGLDIEQSFLARLASAGDISNIDLAFLSENSIEMYSELMESRDELFEAYKKYIFLELAYIKKAIETANVMNCEIINKINNLNNTSNVLSKFLKKVS